MVATITVVPQYAMRRLMNMALSSAIAIVHQPGDVRSISAERGDVARWAESGSHRTPPETLVVVRRSVRIAGEEE